MNHSRSTDLGLLLMRLMLAVVFVFHGAQKLFGAFDGPGLEGMTGYLQSLGLPFPAAGAFLAGAAELLGGLALATGIGLRLAAAPLVFTMLVASFTAHTGFAAQSGGMEYSLTLAVLTAGLALTGAGRYSLAGRKASAADGVDPRAARTLTQS